MFKKNKKTKEDTLKEKLIYVESLLENSQTNLKEERHGRELDIRRLMQEKKLALDEKDSEIKHFKDDEIKKVKEELEVISKENAVLKKEIEMLTKITDLNADVIDVKGLVKDLINKLPSINISGLSVNSNKHDNDK